ncbi:hypothetical protein V1281_007343 [Nitrobacteraceae bacterium AZCC 2161]
MYKGVMTDPAEAQTTALSRPAKSCGPGAPRGIKPGRAGPKSGDGHLTGDGDEKACRPPGRARDRPTNTACGTPGVLGESGIPGALVLPHLRTGHGCIGHPRVPHGPLHEGGECSHPGRIGVAGIELFVLFEIRIRKCSQHAHPLTAPRIPLASSPGSWPYRRSSDRSSRFSCACSRSPGDAAGSETFPARSPPAHPSPPARG